MLVLIAAFSILCVTGNVPGRLLNNTAVGTVTRQVEQDGIIVEVTEEVVIHSRIIGSDTGEVRRDETSPNQINKQDP